MPAPSSLESSFRVTVTLGGVYMGEWDAVTGGASSAGVPKTALGSNPKMQRTLAGKVDSDDLTLTKIFAYDTCIEMERSLLAGVGIMSVVANRSALDERNVTVGNPLIYLDGVVSKVEPVSFDANSTTTAKIVVTATGGHWS